MEETQVTDVLNKHAIVEEKKLDVFSPSCLVSLPALDLEESKNNREEKGLNKKREEVKEDFQKIKGIKNDVTNVPIKRNFPKNVQENIEEKKLDVFSPSCLVSLPASNQDESVKKGKNYATDVPIIHTVTEKEQRKTVEKKLDVYPPSLLVSLSASKPEDVKKNNHVTDAQIKYTGSEKEQGKIVQEKKLDVFSSSFLVSLLASDQKDSKNDQVEDSDDVQSKNRKREEVKERLEKQGSFKKDNNDVTEVRIQHLITENEQENNFFLPDGK